MHDGLACRLPDRFLDPEVSTPEPQSPSLLVRPLIASGAIFVLGIHLGHGEGAWLWPILAALAGLFWMLFMSAQRRILAILGLPLAFLALGFALSRLESKPKETLSKAIPGFESKASLLVEGHLESAPEQRAKGYRFTIRLLGASDSPIHPLKPIKGRAWVFSEALPCGEPGDRLRLWLRLRKPSPPQFAGDFDFEAFMALQGLSFIGRVKRGDACLCLKKADDAGLWRTIEVYRAKSSAAIDRVLDPPASDLVRALAIGDASGLSFESRNAFQKAGLSHLLAVSGLHLAVVIGFVLLGLGSLTRRIPALSLRFGAKRSAAVFAIPAALFYALWVGARPATVRAAVMAVAMLLGEISLRKGDGLSFLALAAMLMLAVQPSGLYSASFQLSFAAVASLMLLMPALSEALRLDDGKWPKPLKWLASGFLTSLSASLGTLALVLFHFGQVSLIGLFSNLVATPLVSALLVPLAALAGLLGAIQAPFSDLLIALSGKMALALLYFAEAVASWPLASLALPKPSLWEGLLMTTSLLFVASSRLFRRIAVLSMLLLLLSVGLRWADKAFQQDLIVHFLPVGHGDAILLEFPGGEAVLVDTGPMGQSGDAATRVILPFLRERRISELALLILTHPDADHIGGSFSLVKGVKVKRILFNGDDRPGKGQLREALRRLPLETVNADTPAFHFGGDAGNPPSQATLEILLPKTLSEAETANDASLVTLVTLGDHKLLLTGDLEAAGEARLLARYPADKLRSDVLKLGHHGSKSSSSEAFLKAVKPAHAIVSVGAGGRFGLPNAEVLRRAEAVGATLWRTDKQGLITVRMGDAGVTVQSYRRTRIAR